MGVGASVCFVLAAMLVPMPQPAAARNALDVSRSIDQMQKQVDVLEEEQILESPEADEIREAMNRVGEEAQGDDPSKTWEALDHLAQNIDLAADEATELARQRMEEAAGAEALAEALSQGLGQEQSGLNGLDTQQLGGLMDTLADLARAAAGEPTLDSAELPPGLAEMFAESGLDASSLDPELLQQLADAMGDRQAELLEMVESLCEAGMCEGSGSGQKLSLAEIDSQELLDWLEGEGRCDAEGLLRACAGIRAGRGAITRGPGHAEMVWQDPSSSVTIHGFALGRSCQYLALDGQGRHLQTVHPCRS